LQVLVDKETKLLTGGGIQYMSLPPLTLKGIDGPVEVFTPMDSKMKETVRSTDLAERYLADEHDQLEKMILTGNNGVTLVLTGDRGSGKSILVDVRGVALPCV
jgi:ABC-type polysaccharide/polyol phosphate transport system ATPase subunit